MLEMKKAINARGYFVLLIRETRFGGLGPLTHNRLTRGCRGIDELGPVCVLLQRTILRFV
jgi:hypothetical protein